MLTSLRSGVPSKSSLSLANVNVHLALPSSNRKSVTRKILVIFALFTKYQRAGTVQVA